MSKVAISRPVSLQSAAREWAQGENSAELRVRLVGRREDGPVGRLLEPELADRSRLHSELSAEPRREPGRQLGVDPNDHAARIG